MMQWACDNGGKRVPPDVQAANPVAASGQTLTDAATGGNHTATVVAGAVYAFTCLPAPVAAGTMTDITFVFSITGTILTAANIEWVCTPGNTILIQIPDNVVTLNYESLGSGGSGYLRRIQ